MRIVAPTQAQIERVGEDAHLLEVIMSIAQTMHVLLMTIRSFALYSPCLI